ncbi:triose-phosphate isomerase [Arundinibacter roseus]|uniref:Triosephosphate isomerase n=1 Tax=Arundinibacter roseus TaxID=2070510 RepID=A0A4R4KKY9_9BACT|nr:triose-phosphate isomerase [Arundinibacter roseus]TDB68878.1 triose-phosphate isomerase [Arundinibacter roseus]
MRKKIVAGNWKMNKTLDEALSLTSEVVHMINDEVLGDVEVVLCVPSLYLTTLSKYVENAPKIILGAQNCHEKASGAFTGEISAPMLKAIGIPYVILGHSERRQYFAETGAQLAAKVDSALENGLTPIFCCGESLEQRQNEDFIEVVKTQISESLFHLSAEQLQAVVIAYEPIWAIGTGLTASAEQAQDMHAALRAHLAGKYGQAVADSISILYGGSVGAGNAAELFACPDVDGGLVGGASLKSRDFTEIVKARQ